MNLIHLESFYHVARLQSFTNAAEYLSSSKGLVSRHVNQLEKALDAQLFYRTTRVIKLTEEGNRLFERAAEIINLASTAERELQDKQYGKTGVIRFTAPVHIGERILSDILPQFKAEFPKVNLDLNLNPSMEGVEHGENDIAMRFSVENSLPDNVVARYLNPLKIIFVASPKYLSTVDDIKTVKDLSGVEVIMQDSIRDNSRFFYQSNSVTPHSLKTAQQVTANHYSSLLMLAKLHYGLVALPYFYAEQALNSGELEHVLPESYLSQFSVSIIHARYRKLPEKMTAFKSLLINWCEAHPHYFTDSEPC